MFRVLFLILILTGSFVYAQTIDKKPAEPLPEAVKAEEIGKATNEYIKALFDGFMLKLDADPDARGYIINYGSANEIAKREKQIKNAIAFRKYETARLTFVRGGFEKTVRTEFWVVPAGAESPIPSK